MNLCIHCGSDCGKTPIVWNEHHFCCEGCKTVYQILNENQLCQYYQIDSKAGIKIDNQSFTSQYEYLDNPEIVSQLLTFSEGKRSKLTLYIPAIHCSSCIWLLENLQKLNKGILNSLVDFTKKEVHISFDNDKISLRAIVELLVSLHYVPQITLDKLEKSENQSINRSIIYKIGIAGFCFGNTMLLSLPEYLSGGHQFLGQEFRNFFAILNLILSLPVFFYSANDYLISAYKTLKNRLITIDLPIAIGIIALFVESAYQIISQTGVGYVDSFCGLLFFLLIGKWYQNKTYQALSFERNYKSYFPVAVTQLIDNKEISIQLKDLKVGDKLLIRNYELIPADSILLRGEANIDYSFVSGESSLVQKGSGDFLYAGGRQVGSSIEIQIVKDVIQSHLTQLWNQESKTVSSKNLSFLIDKVSQRFTLIVLIISVLTTIFWAFFDIPMILKAVTSVLIVACPCALSLAMPFAFGNTMQLFGNQNFYLKKSGVVEQLSDIDTIVFDKTGTITQSGEVNIIFDGKPLEIKEIQVIKSVVRHSTHPSSVAMYNYLPEAQIIDIQNFKEIVGKGISASIDDINVKIGSANFLNLEACKELSSKVYLSINEQFRGVFLIQNKYRESLSQVFESLEQRYELHLISGDNESEKNNLLPLFKTENHLHFNLSPQAKLDYIRFLQQEGKKVLMVGDGLNDAGALRESNAGISIADNVYHFSPACDAILEAQQFQLLPQLLNFSRIAMKIVKQSFAISFIYNAVGLSFAVSGNLTPIVAAILMPLSSVSVVAFVTFSVRWKGQCWQKTKTPHF